METISDYFLATQHACCRRIDKSRRALPASDLTEEDIKIILASEMSPRYDYLNEELPPDFK